MEKDEIVSIANQLYDECLCAASYFSIIEQYRKIKNRYIDEINMSPAFYEHAFSALQKACFMELAKLYESSNSKVNSIGRLLKISEENISVFPEYKEVEINENGRTVKQKRKYRHELSALEKVFYKSEVESQINFTKVLSEVFAKKDDIVKDEDVPIIIELTFSEYIKLFQKVYSSLSKERKCVRIQRNKLYAHNDIELIENEEILHQKNGILYKDIKKLIDFGFDVTIAIIGVLTGINKARSYSNINDLEHTLRFVKIGIESQNG